MNRTQNPPEITIVPLPDGDFEARSGSLVVRGATAGEAEWALMELFDDLVEGTRPPQDAPRVGEDELPPAPEER